MRRIDADELYEKVKESSGFMKEKGLSPVLCNAGSNAIHHHFFCCPRCGSEVGGFIITGKGEDDWSTHEDKFCKECGQKIDWSKTEFATIYRY